MFIICPAIGVVYNFRILLTALAMLLFSLVDRNESINRAVTNRALRRNAWLAFWGPNGLQDNSYKLEPCFWDRIEGSIAL